MSAFVAGRQLARWALLALLLLATVVPAAAQDTAGGEDDAPPRTEPDYVELFDPDDEDPQEPPESSLPEFPLTGLDDDSEAKEEVPEGTLRPWDPEPKQMPARVLEPGDPRDPRSVELFYYGCAGDLQRRDVTLFANGTIRLRRGPLDGQEMRLEEVGPAELRRHLGRLLRIRAARDFPERLDLRDSLEGYAVDTCRFGLDLPGFDAVTLETGSLDVLPLPLRQLQQYADELAGFTRPLSAPDTLASDYAPAVGDVLRTRDGVAYRVEGFTTDGGAAELVSLDGSWQIFVRIEEFPDFFSALDPILGASDPR